MLAWHTDRLHRSPTELEDYVDVCERRKVVTQTVKAGELDLATTPSGRAVARTLGAWARFEVEHKSERTRRAQRQAAEAGRWLGGRPPFGWDLRVDGSVIVDRREARRCRAADRLLAGASLGSLVDDLNARGVTTATGRPWNYTSLRQVLTRPRNSGLSTWHGEVVGTSVFPPLLSEETLRGVVTLLSDPTRRRSTSNRLRWMLAGLALCACGSTVRSGAVRSNPAKGTLRVVYRCRERGSGHVARAAACVDATVGELVIARVSKPDAIRLLTPPRLARDAQRLQREAGELRARLAEAADMYADGEVSRAGHERIVSRVQRQLDEVLNQMSNTSSSALFGVVDRKDPRAAWHALSVERRRAVVDELMTVTILPERESVGTDSTPACCRSTGGVDDLSGSAWHTCPHWAKEQRSRQ